VRIRPSRPQELARLAAIEIASATLFAEIGMISDAFASPPDLGDGVVAIWVATDNADLAIAYLALREVAGNAHLAQVSVDPAYSRRGIGRALVEHAVVWARRHGFPAMTLTTYAEVPWNAPYYERCGFRRVPEAELTPSLRAIRRRERAAGLDAWPRVAMIRTM
jgi:GNAT superfamily N-acetyltransferase